MDTFTFRNNTFESEVALDTANVVNSKMVGNIGLASTCKSGVAYSYNVWTQRTCGSTDRQASNVKSFFQNPAAHDWRLKAGSPAIDRGNPNDYPATDRAGNARNGLPDAGAYEYGGGASTPTPTPTPDPDDEDDDTQAPAVPQGMAWTTATQTSIGVRWNATTDNIGVTGYRLYRNGTQAGTTTGTSYSVTGLACGTSYTIGLTAVDAAGNESNRAEASGTTSTAACSANDTQAPTAPGNLTVSGATATSIQLNWSASTDNSGAVSYEVFRDGTQVGDATGTSYTVTGITDCSTTPALSVRAVDAAGNVSGRPSRTIRCTWQ